MRCNDFLKSVQEGVNEKDEESGMNISLKV